MSRSLISKIRQVEPDEFEHLVADLWGQMGYQTKVTQQSQDNGIDVRATHPLGETVLIQAKRYGSNSRVGVREIREYAGLYAQEDSINEVWVVTTGGFTSQAEKVADEANVELVGSNRLTDLINQHEKDKLINSYYPGSGAEDTEEKSSISDNSVVTQSDTVSNANSSKNNLAGRDLSQTDLSGADLSGRDLSGRDLSGRDLSGRDLSGADLSHTDFSGTDLSDANLSGANLRGTNLSEARLSGADLSGRDLSQTDLLGADLSDANLSNTVISDNTNLSEARLLGANLSSAYLSETDLSGADLRGTTFSGADLSETDLRGATLRGAVLSGADLSDANFHRADLTNATLPDGESKIDKQTQVRNSTNTKPKFVRFLETRDAQALEEYMENPDKRGLPPLSTVERVIFGLGPVLIYLYMITQYGFFTGTLTAVILIILLMTVIELSIKYIIKYYN
jgi:uncharacterized protein YjbI with pentapeptide repeats